MLQTNRSILPTTESTKFNIKKHFHSKKLSPKLVNEINETKDFGIKSLALLGGYSYDQLKTLVEHKCFGNIKKFQDSKPSVEKGKIKSYSYRAPLKGKYNKFKCVWYKFKSPEVINQKLDLPVVNSELKPHKVLQLAFKEATKLVPKAADIVRKKGYTFSFESEDFFTGFSWISSNVEISRNDKHIKITTPTLITNKHVPKFGGMTYCKVLTPRDMAEILIYIAKGSPIFKN
jgi:hypothetical protein